MKTTHFRTAAVAFLFCLVAMGQAHSQKQEALWNTSKQDVDFAAVPVDAPETIHYQGRFTDPGGVPLDGPVNLTFRLFNADIDGANLWTETHTSVTLNEGVATVLLGSLASFPEDAFTSPVRFIEIEIDGVVLAPRLRLSSVPFALEANRLQGKSASDFELKGSVLVLSIGDGTPPNQGSNRVHWQNLTGVPAGFEDNEDSGATVHAELDSLEADDHPQYLLRTEVMVSDSSPPNQGSNQVHWDNLVGVPSGFADGADNMGAGGEVDHGELKGLEDDDHPQYATDQDLNDHTGAANPHPQYALDADLSSHTENPSAHHEKTTNASELTAGLLDPERLGNGIIDSLTIKDGSISQADLKPGILDELTLGPGSVTDTNLAADAVTTAKVANEAITAGKLAPMSVDSTKVIPGSIGTVEIQDESLTSGDLLNETGVVFFSDASTQALADTVTDLGSTTITCPGSGWILARATMQSCVSPGATPADNTVRLSVGLNPDDLDSSSEVFYQVRASAGATFCNGLSAQRLIPVSAGATTVWVTGFGGGPDSKEVSRVTLSLIYISTEYN